MIKKISPVMIPSWIDTLRKIKKGDTVSFNVGYKETNSLRNKATYLKKEGYTFTVSKVDDDTTQITRIK